MADVTSRLDDILPRLCSLLKQLRSRPIGAAKACELELETCASQLRDALQNQSKYSPKMVQLLRLLRKNVAELQDRIFLVQKLNSGLLARHIAQVNGYDAVGRPAAYRPKNGDGL